ncbi:hypothetical protein B0J11DRAFT_578481 [Dendryphion nanum]|uniref:Aminoglycoside phosphotransferase domain-containing protein n=1 Tax=Dendryphion nanum TaxID=256645 RepID=A0A9P9E063_9PLEO|nr:hypothetical protein B0J11DRAFT_578481 [Dendryphion nanum]
MSSDTVSSSTPISEDPTLSTSDLHHIIKSLRYHYPYHHISSLAPSAQGGCSHTLLAQYSNLPPTTTDYAVNWREESKIAPPKPKSLILQIRSPNFALDLSLVNTARKVYEKDTVPHMREISLQYEGRRLEKMFKVYEMDLLPGVPYEILRIRREELDTCEWTRQVELMKSLAQWLAGAWPKEANFDDKGKEKTRSTRERSTRADSPMELPPRPNHISNEKQALHKEKEPNSPVKHPRMLDTCPGRVGSIIIPKLEKLARELPSQALRDKANEVLENIISVNESTNPIYPVVFNHGDLIPSNILITPDTAILSGVVDWGEAELLPFGTCFYSVENLLGYLSDLQGSPTWTYYTQAEELREIFWSRLGEEVGVKSGEMERWRGEVKVMWDLGILLWYGYAWDGGRIDRVVERGRDTVEVECLEAFLRVPY